MFCSKDTQQPILYKEHHLHSGTVHKVHRCRGSLSRTDNLGTIPRYQQGTGWVALCSLYLNIRTFNLWSKIFLVSLQSRQIGQISGTSQDPSSKQVMFQDSMSLSISKYKSGAAQLQLLLLKNSTGSSSQLDTRLVPSGGWENILKF